MLQIEGERKVIGQLCGQVVDKDMERVLLDVAGVGYEIACPLTVLDKPQKEIKLRLRFTPMFARTKLRCMDFQVFRATNFSTVDFYIGIGPKIDSCLSGMDRDALISAISSGDVKRLTTIQAASNS